MPHLNKDVLRSSSRGGGKLGRLILVRHGESIWNVTDAARNLVQRFTGWIDIPLTPRGRNQAKAAGRCLRSFGLKADAVYTSLLRRAKDTFDEIEATAPHLFRGTKIVYTWRLNERHYGSLVGMSKEEAGRKLCVDEEQVMDWRRSWDARPPPLLSHELAEWEDYAHAQPQTFVYENGLRRHMLTEKGVELPTTESLEDCYKRIEPILQTGIYPRIHRGDTVLVVAHANVMRAIVRHLDVDSMSTTQLKDVRVPSAVPLIYDFTAVGAAPGAPMRPTKPPTALGMRGRYLTTHELIKHQLRVVEHKDDDAAGAAATVRRPLTQADAFLDLLEHGLQHTMEYCHAVDGLEAVVVTDSRLRIVHATRLWQQLSGFDLNDVRGRTCTLLLGPKSDAKAVADLDERLQLGLPGVSKLVHYRKDGTPCMASMTFLPIYDWR